MKLDKLINERETAAQWMIDDIKKVCTTLPKRDPGSEGELAAAEYFKDLCLNEYDCNEAYVEEFEEHPQSFMGWIWITMALEFIGLVLIFLNAVGAVASAALSVIALVVMVCGLALALLQFGLYWKVVDKLYPKKMGHNMWASKLPTGEVKQRVYFNGHMDAVWEWPVNYALGGVGFEGHIIITVIGVLYYMAIAIMYLVNPALGFLSAMAKWGLLFLPFWCGMNFIWSWWDPKKDKRHIVDGANDNLSGCYMGLAILKYLKENNIDMEHTEVGVILSGSEEAGLRGAKAWCDAHKDDPKFNDGIPTYIYGYDTIHDPKYLLANYRDLNGTVKTDAPLNDLFMQSCEETGTFVKKGMVPPLGGATDGAAFAQAGFRAGDITGLNHKLEDYYHTRRDSYDNMDLKGLADCYAASVKCLEHIENGEFE